MNLNKEHEGWWHESGWSERYRPAILCDRCAVEGWRWASQYLCVALRRSIIVGAWQSFALGSYICASATFHIGVSGFLLCSTYSLSLEFPGTCCLEFSTGSISANYNARPLDKTTNILVVLFLEDLQPSSILSAYELSFPQTYVCQLNNLRGDSALRHRSTTRLLQDLPSTYQTLTQGP